MDMSAQTRANGSRRLSARKRKQQGDGSMGRSQDISAAATTTAGAPASMFDVGINEKLPLSQLAVLGLQNVFGMTGMFVFPGILGRSFHLEDAQIGYLYCMPVVV